MDVSDLPPALATAEARLAAAVRADEEAAQRGDGLEQHLAAHEMCAAHEDLIRHLRAAVRQHVGEQWYDSATCNAISSDILFRLKVARRTETHAAMVALTNERDLLFVPGNDGLRFPITTIPDTESGLDAAMRALEEQTGASMRAGRSPGRVCPTLAEPDRPIVFVAITNWIELHDAHGLFDSTVLIPAEDVPDHIVAGRISDTITIDAYRLAVRDGLLLT